MSLLLRPALPAHAAGQLTMCLGLAAVEGIESVTGLRPALKWPNDLLLEGRKLGGMLTELRLDGERLAYAVLGLGVNVNVDFGDGRMDDGRWSMVNGQWSIVRPRRHRYQPLNGPWPRSGSRRAAGCDPGALRGVVRRGVGGRVAARGLGRPAGHGGAASHGDDGRRQHGRDGRRRDTWGALLLHGDADATEHVIWSGDVTAVRRADQP